jgi:hypothetical protein
LIHFGAVSAPGVMAAGAARGCGCPAREKVGGIDALSLARMESDRQTKDSIAKAWKNLNSPGKLSPKSEGIVIVIVSPMKRWP